LFFVVVKSRTTECHRGAKKKKRVRKTGEWIEEGENLNKAAKVMKRPSSRVERKSHVFIAEMEQEDEILQSEQ
jgi:hypothetical protein